MRATEQKFFMIRRSLVHYSIKFTVYKENIVSIFQMFVFK